MTIAQSKGQAAELDALNYLQRQGLSLIDQNYRCRYGEIDLIMKDGQTLVFIEVRKRQSAKFGGAIASVAYTKQQKLILTAQHFLTTLKKMPVCRFDVIGYEGSALQPVWIKDAFQLAS
ncbi:YraN family protein [Leeia sp. TBRC 13508]|uniref:UPF0102 protein LIN78_03525 n=1 Tax=Leeia speluncae TaxID=2884804 RepID=A0ABS8D3P7_9NEIS|nr:YraN family protein [Leeia speluncae]MCB6182621.1 YraN family protein [Leeia speluncae]